VHFVPRNFLAFCSRNPPSFSRRGIIAYWFAQEALNNVVKHSKAARADLKIAFETAEIIIEVMDNGNGFVAPKRPTELTPSGHFGWLGIHERADLIGARFEIESALGEGARLKVVLNEAPP